MKQNNYLLNFLKVTIFSFLLIATAPLRAEIKVVTTIKPLHSLIANVMDGVGEPSLIIEGSTSPHSFTLKPSHAKLLEEADLIFWVGEGIETFMERPLESIVKNAEVVEFMEVDSIEKLKFREESIFGDHDDHDDEGDNYVPRLPAYRIGGSLAYAQGLFSGDVAVRYSGRQGKVAHEEEITEAFTMVDASVTYRLFSGDVFHDISLVVRNLTNTDARLHTSFQKEIAPLPGREVSLVYRMNF